MYHFPIFSKRTTTEQITAAAKAIDQAGLLEELNGDRAALALELVRQSLPENELALFDAEARTHWTTFGTKLVPDRDHYGLV